MSAAGKGTPPAPEDRHTEKNGGEGGEETAVIPLKELEKREIRKALRLCGTTTEGKKEAAARLGIGIATLYRKIDEYYQNDKNALSK